jgi:hypothetical protein
MSMIHANNMRRIRRHQASGFRHQEGKENRAMWRCADRRQDKGGAVLASLKL